jgi:acetyltransferase-like isoleucine patch superfamily enzyme
MRDGFGKPGIARGHLADRPRNCNPSAGRRNPRGRPCARSSGAAAGLEFGRPISIGRNVWIGGGALILPGVIVGDDTLIGADSVVTRDVPAGATAFGNPARVQKHA